jgi:hypothetical protein
MRDAVIPVRCKRWLSCPFNESLNLNYSTLKIGDNSEFVFRQRSGGFQSQATQDNACLQLRRAISIQAEGTRLLEKDAIAPSAARLCYVALDAFEQSESRM